MSALQITAPITITVEQATNGSAPNGGSPISGVQVTLSNGISGTTKSQGQVTFPVLSGTYSVSYESPVPIATEEESKSN